MSRAYRNADVPSVPAAVARERVLAYLRKHEHTDGTCLASKSSLGYAAFAERRFAMPQGAAFAVAKIVHDMEKDGLLRWHTNTHGRLKAWGYHLTPKGVKATATHA